MDTRQLRFVVHVSLNGICHLGAVNGNRPATQTAVSTNVPTGTSTVEIENDFLELSAIAARFNGKGQGLMARVNRSVATQ